MRECSAQSSRIPQFKHCNDLLEPSCPLMPMLQWPGATGLLALPVADCLVGSEVLFFK